ncbi:MAG: hypothetical protein FWG89_00115 [Treponema sp.]|nr:hypothetical protein [Treponema sp.]
MAQLSLYIENSMANRLSKAAKISKCSVSKYVAALVSEHLLKNESEDQKKQILNQLCGAMNDPTFTMPSELSWEDEIPRNFDLI